MEVWFNPRCSKCRIAKSALDEAGLTYHLRYYLEQPPTVEELRNVLTQLDLEPWDICREADASDVGAQLPHDRDPAHRERWLELLASYPALIQRPLVVTDDGTAYVARDSDRLAAAIKDATS